MGTRRRGGNLSAVPSQERYVEYISRPRISGSNSSGPWTDSNGFAQGQAPLEEFTVDAADWIQSSTHLGPGFWGVHAVIPFFPLSAESAGRDALATNCRLSVRLQYALLPLLSSNRSVARAGLSPCERVAETYPRRGTRMSVCCGFSGDAQPRRTPLLSRRVFDFSGTELVSNKMNLTASPDSLDELARRLQGGAPSR